MSNLSPKTIKYLQLAGILLPVIILLGVIGVNYANTLSGTKVRIPITGYDPRDLLRGHYITYRYDWNWDESAAKRCSGQNCAVCLTPASSTASGTHYNPKARLTSLSGAKENCEIYIFGQSRNGRFVINGTNKNNHYGLTRYFIPESEAKRLDKMVRSNDAYDFDIGLRVNSQGRAFITELYIDNISMDEWLRQNPDQDTP